MTALTIECRGEKFRLTDAMVLVRQSDGAAFKPTEEIELPDFIGTQTLAASDIVRCAYLDSKESSGAWFDPGTGDHVPFHNAAKWSEDELALARQFYGLSPYYDGAEE